MAENRESIEDLRSIGLGERLALLEQWKRRTEGAYAHWMEHMRERIEASAELSGCRLFRCDLHIHSTYSDGVCEVEEISEWAKRAGLDLVAVTDHNTLAHKAECECHSNLLAGVEVNDDHHLVGLNVRDEWCVGLNVREEWRRLKCSSLKDMFACLRPEAEIVYLPHPTGWHGTVYGPEMIEEVKELSSPFVMEIGNGGENFCDYYDEQDASAVRLWDELLSAGKHVVAVGNSDAHQPFQIGMVWNGLLGGAEEKDLFPERLMQGEGFVSNGPVLNLKAGGEGMGSSVQVGKGKVEIKAEAHESVGISSLRVRRSGEIIREEKLGGRRRSACLEFTDIVSAGHSYYRAECLSVDGRRAYTNPIRVGRK